jgi:hypothetical protein
MFAYVCMLCDDAACGKRRAEEQQHNNMGGRRHNTTTWAEGATTPQENAQVVTITTSNQEISTKFIPHRMSRRFRRLSERHGVAFASRPLTFQKPVSLKPVFDWK